MVSFAATNMVKIVLPWPDPGLSPNARLHWRALAQLKRKARDDAAWETVAQVPQEARTALVDAASRFDFRVTFYPPDRRRRDDDNMVASVKASRDGIAQALGVDDRHFRAHYFFADPQAPGRVVFEISPAISNRSDSAAPRKGVNESGPAGACNTEPGLTETAIGGSDHGS